MPACNRGSGGHWHHPTNKEKNQAGCEKPLPALIISKPHLVDKVIDTRLVPMSYDERHV
jgi:hypothetical protein